MSEFFWTAGRLGWGFFSLLVFTALWWLLTDLLWRLKDMRTARLLALMAGGWIVGAGLIIWGAVLLGT